MSLRSLFSEQAGSVTHHAFLRKHEHMEDLGAPHNNPCSTAEAINSYDQVAGDSGECNVGGDPFLWENGGPIVALSDLILPGSALTVFDAFFINDRGQIACLGATPDGNVHACILVPAQWDQEGSVTGTGPSVVKQFAKPSHLKMLRGERRGSLMRNWRH
jgi:hypothetical protein